MLNRIKIFLLIFCSMFLNAGIKTKYGGNIIIRLNEPSSFNYSSSNYSNSIFFSLIYDNFFYLNSDGILSSNLFSSYDYDRNEKKITLNLKPYLSFSDGTRITPENLKFSIKVFLTKEMTTSKKLRRAINSFKIENNSMIITLNYDIPDVLQLLSVPELVLLSMNEKSFSGIFVPDQWESKKFIKLIPNKFYPGGRSYLDYIKIIFYDYYYPDIFLSGRNMKINNYNEFNAGIYQNFYLLFPYGSVGKNSKVALYSLFKIFFSKYNYSELNSLTSTEESPVAINITKFSLRKIRSILKYSRMIIYMTSSLKRYEKDLLDFFNKYKRLNITFNFIEGNKLKDFIKSNHSVKFLIGEKFFKKKTNIVDKLQRILDELSFTRLNEKYLNIMKELEEIKYLKNEELLMKQYSEYVTSIISDGLIFPLYHEKFSIYLKKNILNVKLDYYGRPLFNRVRVK